MIRKIIAAVFRFIHEQELLLKLADHLEFGAPVQQLPPAAEAENGSDTPRES